MQDLFSKVHTEKRHLYGENGILGHRRAVSTTVPSKGMACGHRRTYSNTSSDFKAIILTNPALLKQIEQVNNAKTGQGFSRHINQAHKYFIQGVIPQRLTTEREKLKAKIKTLTDSISQLQQTQLSQINLKNELKAKLKQEKDSKSNSDLVLNKYKKKTNELEILLKRTQEDLKSEKIKNAALLRQLHDKNFNKSLSIETEELFMFQKVTPKSLYTNSPNFPLTPTPKYSISNNPSPINS